MEIITAGTLTTLLVEIIKWLVRTIAGKPTYDFPPLFYSVAVPVSNALMPFALFFLGVIENDPILNMDFVGVLKYIGVIALSSLVSVVAYNAGVKPTKTYVREFNKG